MLLKLFCTLLLLFVNLPSYASGGDDCGIDECNLPSVYFYHPSNDTRANIGLLLEDKQLIHYQIKQLPFHHKLFLNAPLAEANFENEFASINQIASQLNINTDELNAALTRLKVIPEGRCVSSNAKTVAQFLIHINNAQLSLNDKQSLIKERLRLAGLCENAADNLTPLNLTTEPAQGYANYLQACAYFYAGKFDLAQNQFKTLSAHSEAWLKETAMYLLARVYLDQAQGDYDDFDKPKTNNALLTQAKEQFTLYLKSYPTGYYSDSARGLFKKIAWLANDNLRLSQLYQQQLNDLIKNKASDARIIDFITELERKYSFNLSEQGDTWQSPQLAFIGVLQNLRGDNQYTSEVEKTITIELLRSKKAIFEQAGLTELYDYLVLAHDFYIARDYQSVLKHTENDKLNNKEPSNIELSRQVLRGLALGALTQWHQAEELWTSLIKQNNHSGQQVQLQYLLALSYQQQEKLDKIYTQDSLITTQVLHDFFIQFSSPTLVESLLSKSYLNSETRELAFDTFLKKSLIHRQYSEFSRFINQHRLIRTKKPKPLEAVEVINWTKYSVAHCPTLVDTVNALIKQANSATLLNCYGDYLHELSLDNYAQNNSVPASYTTGFDLKNYYLDTAVIIKSFADDFSGNTYSSLDFYNEVIAQNGANEEAQAYALHRAVSCFATAAYNHCGKQDIAPQQRKAWFERLKTEFKDSQWAKKQKYYW